MVMPRLFVSNRLEVLVDAMARVLERPLTSPLHPEVVVVQSRGMERYLSMQLARAHGVCANYRFLFPNAFVSELFAKVLGHPAEESPFDPELLAWRVLKRIPSQVKGTDSGGLRDYLEEDEGDLKRLQLSVVIADTLDQYLLFRPEMVFRWERGEETHWQAELWRDLVKGFEGRHRAALAREFMEVLKRVPRGRADMGERICVFGISALPRFHMEVFSALSRFMEVNLFLMNPCREYWGDIASPHEVSKVMQVRGGGDLHPDLLHLEKGNSLLASMGRLGRDFLDLVSDLGWEETAAFEDPGRGTLLRAIQSEVLDLKERCEEGAARAPLPMGDDSIRFHVCHSPMREVEVLRDQLLFMCEKDPKLTPGDILVMTPDIDVYAPYIQAVFDIPSSSPMWMPFSIADRGLCAESPAAEALLALLDLCEGRFSASAILALLQNEAVRRRFGFAESDLKTLRGWIKDTRIRWGEDVESRVRHGIPPFEQNTWKAGLERMLLGYAMPGGGERLFEGILPYDEIEGSEAELLGRLAEYVGALACSMQELQGPRCPADWSRVLCALLERFFDSEGQASREIQVLRQVVGALDKREGPESPAYEGEVGMRAIRWMLRRRLQREGFGFGFLTGGVTFCAMLPMRSIPSKVLCLIGMNNDAYPREHHAPSFDLMVRHPRKGDRSRRNDDRYLFLEALLSARERLYISYVGRSIQDNSPIPPSVLVSELMDYIAEDSSDSGTQILDRLVTHHRLQAFSPHYFRGEEGLFSYSDENCEAAGLLLQRRNRGTPFVSTGLSSPGEDFNTLDLADLCGFYANPARFILQRRLGVFLAGESTYPEDKEPLELSGLERYRLAQSMVKRRLEGVDLHRLFPLVRASGVIPPGTVGECLYEELTESVEGFAKKAGRYTGEEAPGSVDVDIRLAGFPLRGRIDGITREGLVHFRFAKLKGRDTLKGWIHHLSLNMAAPRGCSLTTTVVGLDRVLRFSPAKAADRLLTTLLEKLKQGLTMPLHLFPDSSWMYARERWGNRKEPQEALAKARSIWTGGERSRGECEDPYYRLCFRYQDPLDGEFVRLCEDIFIPLLDHVEERKE